METIVGKIKSLVTFGALRLAFEQGKTAFGRDTDGARITLAPLIERRLGGNNGALKTGQGLGDGLLCNTFARIGALE